jgi:hypothetical protein
MEIEQSETNVSIEDLDSLLRLDIYVIDSGWDSAAHRVLCNSLGLIKNYLVNHNLYVLSPDQSTKLLSAHSELIEKDPVLMVVDPLALKLRNPHGYGARLVLGQIYDESRVEWLIRMFLRVVNTHTETLDIAHTFQEYNYREGVKGAIEIVFESFGDK